MKRTVLQINSVVNFLSTGRIVEEIGQEAIRNGWNSVIAYGRYMRPSQSKLIKIGTDLDLAEHLIQTRLFDRHGLSSKSATYKLIDQIKILQPDVIHLHNLHGYYISIEILFKYLSTIETPIVWTLHDCWPFTGHCSHFEQVSCEKWKTLCFKCPQKSKYPASFWVDRSQKNYLQKKNLFNSLKKLSLVPVSDWLASTLNQSFLSGNKINVIKNGIDLEVFNPSNASINVREIYNLSNEFIILGVASSWSNNKGLKEFVKLSENNNWKIVLIGLTYQQKKHLPDSIIKISKTENLSELISFYTAADVFLNPTYQDTFPTVNLEALACGTPVITYSTGGSPEVLDENTGIVVEKGNFQELIEAIETVRSNGKIFYSNYCRERAEKNYNKNERYLEYLKLYESMI